MPERHITKSNPWQREGQWKPSHYKSTAQGTASPLIPKTIQDDTFCWEKVIVVSRPKIKKRFSPTAVWFYSSHLSESEAPTRSSYDKISKTGQTTGRMHGARNSPLIPKETTPDWHLHLREGHGVLRNIDQDGSKLCQETTTSKLIKEKSILISGSASKKIAWILKNHTCKGDVKRL